MTNTTGPRVHDLRSAVYNVLDHRRDPGGVRVSRLAVISDGQWEVGDRAVMNGPYGSGGLHFWVCGLTTDPERPRVWYASLRPVMA